MIQINNNVIKQVLLLTLIILMIIVVFTKLSYFIPGGLGAITLYILLRNWYFKLVEKYKWKSWMASTTLILGLLLLLVLPLYGIAAVLKPMIENAIGNTAKIQQSITQTINYLNEKVPQLELSPEKILKYLQTGLAYVPSVLQSTANVVANIFTALFILYFMFSGGRLMERVIKSNVPLLRKNKDELWAETRVLVVSNALGIPFLAFCQGLVAIIGYWIFGVPNAVLFGIITGVATVVPVIGTMIVWVPICIYLLAVGQTGSAIGLALYCLIVVGGIDNVLRFVFVKKFGDVHPLITVFGVILGLDMFGVMGLIFGPLLMAYILLLLKIYKAEFGKDDNAETPPAVSS